MFRCCRSCRRKDSSPVNDGFADGAVAAAVVAADGVMSLPLDTY